MEQTMDRNELLRHELLALKEIRLSGASIDRTTMRQLRDMEMITELHDGRLRLTNEGRKMLVRGSPSLWNVAS
jgi:ribosomal protein S19E (S16A)